MGCALVYNVVKAHFRKEKNIAWENIHKPVYYIYSHGIKQAILIRHEIFNERIWQGKVPHPSVIT